MPTNLRAAGRVASVAAGAILAISVAVPSAQSPKSHAAAKDLSDVMDRLKLDSIAAADPEEPGAFVAALYFQDAQLLVVSAKYAAPSLLAAKLAKKDYRDVYIDLNSASVAGSKIFVMDTSANGLVARPGDGAADSWEQGDKTTAFDGDWKRAKVSEDEYDRSFAEADEKYARILAILAEHAKKGGS